MKFYEKFSQGSQFHLVKRAENSISLRPLGNTREAHIRFQTIAHEVFEHEFNGDYEIVFHHRTSQFIGDLYDLIILRPMGAE